MTRVRFLPHVPETESSAANLSQPNLSDNPKQQKFKPSFFFFFEKLIIASWETETGEKKKKNEIAIL